MRYRNRKIENQEDLEIAIDMVRKKLELEIMTKVRIEELEKLKPEKPKKLEKLEKPKLKKLREPHKLRVELESIGRLETKRIINDFHELVIASNINLRMQSKEAILNIA